MAVPIQSALKQIVESRVARSTAVSSVEPGDICLLDMVTAQVLGEGGGLGGPDTWSTDPSLHWEDMI